jgi:hypothetical protein
VSSGEVSSGSDSFSLSSRGQSFKTAEDRIDPIALIVDINIDLEFLRNTPSIGRRQCGHRE